MKSKQHKIDITTLVEHAASSDNARAAWDEYIRIRDAGGAPEIYYTPFDSYVVRSAIPIKGEPK